MANGGPFDRRFPLGVGVDRNTYLRRCGVLLAAGLLLPGAIALSPSFHLAIPGSSTFPAAPLPILHPTYLVGMLQHAIYSLAAGTGDHRTAPTSACAWMRAPPLRLCGPTTASAFPRPGAATPGWSLAGGTPPLQLPTGFEITYDAADRYTLLLGLVPDFNDSGGVTDTWAWELGNWTPIVTARGPVSCSGSSLAYDSEDGYVVFLGGAYVGYSTFPCPSAGQTWTYRAGVWTQQFPTVSPSLRTGASFSDDPADGYMLLFGGMSNGTPYGPTNDTWSFAAGSWTKLAPATSPSNRSQAGMAYDAYDGYVLLFGGLGTSYYTQYSDTWNFSHGTWTQLYPNGTPPVPQPDAFSYDAADHEIIYTTAYSWNATAIESTWAYSAGNWTDVSTTSGPVQRLDAATTYDATAGVLVFFGGLGVGYLADTWTFLNGGWSNRTATTPPPRVNAATAYDAADGYLVMFGGSRCPYPSSSTCGDLGDTWILHRNSWTELFPSPAPSPRERAGLVYDALDGYVLLFGGDQNGTALNDTWEFLAETWTKLAPTTAPSPRSAGGMVYDGSDAYVLLFGGDAHLAYPYSGDYRDTWTYAGGMWTNRTSTLTTAPPAESTNRLVYDRSDGFVLLFGTFARVVGGNSPWSEGTNETWEYHAGAWSNVTSSVGVPPVARADAAITFDSALNEVILFGGSSTPGSWLGDTWALHPNSPSLLQPAYWVPLQAPVNPFNRSGATFEYTPDLGGPILFGGTSGYYPANYQSTSCGWFGWNLCGDTWLWGGNLPSPFDIASFRATAGSVDVGITAQLVASAQGGLPPYGYAYAGLPPGCTSANVSVLNCLATQTGAFAITVTVTDSGTNRSQASLTLHVVPHPVFSSFVAAPATVTVGNGTVFEGVVTGGIPPFAITYLGLPASCASAPNFTLPCTPTASGRFTVTVTAVDADGILAQSQTTLVVQAAGSGGPSVASFLAAPALLVLGNSTTLTVGTVTVGTGGEPIVYAYTGLPPGCTSNDSPRLACAPTAAGRFAVELTVTAANGLATAVGTNLSVTPVGGGLDPLVTAFGVAPNPATVGETVVVSVTASGGSGGLTYRYEGLPPGCPTANLAQLPCALRSAGEFQVEGVVGDAEGHTTGVLAHLLVEGSSIAAVPTVTAFFPTPAVVNVGESTIFDVTASGGTPPYVYLYPLLPPGCVSADTPTLPCAPTTIGIYIVAVNITDSAGGLANSTTVLTVHPAPATNNAGTPLVDDPYLLLGVGALAGVGVAALAASLWVARGHRGRTGETDSRR